MAHGTKSRLAVVAALAALAALAPASAAGASRPTGDSSIDQYLPSVPGAGGDQTVGGNGDNGGNGSQSGSGGGSGPSLPPSTEAQLQDEGTAGAAVTALVEQTGPAGAAPETGGVGSQGNSGSGTKADGGPAPGTVGQLASKTFDGEGGMGALFPLLLGATLVAAIVAFILRRRRDDGADDAG